MKVCKSIALPTATLLGAASAQAGPPLSIEDPGILEPGQWEIITATTATSYDSTDIYQLPALDISVGVIAEKVQLSIAYPYVFVDPGTGESDSDFGNPEIGVKWRFYNSDGLQLAIAPGYSFGITRSVAEIGVGEDTGVAVLPLAAEYEINERWRLNGEVGYAYLDHDRDEVTYGAALANGLNDRWELLFELSGATVSGLDDSVLNARVGFDYAIREDFHLLLSTATGIHEPDGEVALDYDIYLGLQFFL